MLRQQSFHNLQSAVKERLVAVQSSVKLRRVRIEEALEIDLHRVRHQRLIRLDHSRDPLRIQIFLADSQDIGPQLFSEGLVLTKAPEIGAFIHSPLYGVVVQKVLGKAIGIQVI